MELMRQQRRMSLLVLIQQPTTGTPSCRLTATEKVSCFRRPVTNKAHPSLHPCRFPLNYLHYCAANLFLRLPSPVACAVTVLAPHILHREQLPCIS